MWGFTHGPLLPSAQQQAGGSVAYSTTLTVAADLPIVGGTVTPIFATTEPALTPGTLPITGATVTPIFGYGEPALTPADLPINGGTVSPVFSGGGVAYNSGTLVVADLPIVGATVTPAFASHEPALTPADMPITGGTLAPVFGYNEPALTPGSLPIVGGTVTPAFVGTAIYYFSATGSDAADGLTTSTPKQTITAANALVLSPGSSLLFNKGDTFSGALVAQSATLTYSSYGSGAAPIISSGAAAGLTVLNLAGVIVQNLAFAGSGTLVNATHGITFENSQALGTKISGATVANCTVTGYGKNGINIFGSNGISGFTNVSISTCTVTNCTGNWTSGFGTSGIYVGSLTGYGQLSGGGATHTNITITDCIVHDCPGTAGDGNWTGSGIFIGESATGTIDGCVAYMNGLSSNSTAGPIGIWTADSTAVTIQYCESYLNQSGSGQYDGGGIGMDGGSQSCVIQYCYSHDNKGPGFQVYSYDDASLLQDTNNTVRFCISENNGTNNPVGNSEFHIGNDGSRSMTGVAVYNNTIYSAVSTSLPAVYFDGNTISGTFANNIIQTGSPAGFLVRAETGTTLTNMALRGNVYYASSSFKIYWLGTTYTTFAAWQTATSQEKIAGSNVGITGDPLLVTPGTGISISDGALFDQSILTAYKLYTSSSALNTGLGLLALFSINPGTVDFYGNTLGALPTNVGAYDGAAISSATNHSAGTGRRAASSSWNPNWNKKHDDELRAVRGEIADVSEEIAEQQAEARVAEASERAAIRADIVRLKVELKDLKAYEQALLDDEEAVLLMLLTA